MRRRLGDWIDYRHPNVVPVVAVLVFIALLAGAFAAGRASADDAPPSTELRA